MDNDSGDGMVTHFANGVKMILSRGNKYWHGSCGERFDGTEGWVAAADGYSKPDVSSPALLGEFKKVVGEYVARTGRSLNHMRNFLDCVRSRERRSPTRGHAPLDDHRARRQHLHVAQADLKFDPVKEEFVSDDEANRLRSRAMREPYVI